MRLMISSGNHQSADLKRLLGFKHRTFNATDLLYFIHFLKSHYQQSDSLESAFLPDFLIEKEPDNRSSFLTAEKRTTLHLNSASPVEDEFVKKALSAFYDRFFSLEDAPRRTKKHIASPEKNSTCKRLNMYLRWMVRQDKRGVDFGIWKQISSCRSDLSCGPACGPRCQGFWADQPEADRLAYGDGTHQGCCGRWIKKIR